MDDLSLDHPDLDRYFDEPRPEWAAAARQHLVRCRRCAAELAALAELRTLARELPREVPPGRDLWGGILQRISAQPAPDTDLPRPAARPRAWTPTIPRRWLPAAAVLVTVLAAGAIGYRLGLDDRPSLSTATSGTAAEPAQIGLAAFASTEAEYHSTIAALEAELEARRHELSPEAIATVEANLAIIDRAIGEARRAMVVEPANADLPLLLAGAYRSKLELLHRALDLSARS